MNFRVSARILLGAAVLSASCINKDYQLGRGLIDTAQQFDIVNAEFPLSEIRMEMADSLSGYSSTRIVVGAVRDELFGLTTRGSAFTLVPALDTIDLGTNPVVTRFRLHTAADTVSVPNERDRYILQNVNVYELTRPLNFNKAGTTTLPEHGTESIAKGHPVFNGADSLAFDFTDAYSARFLKALQGLIDENHAVDTSFTKYTAAIPGIYVDMDAPLGNGGRINLVKLFLHHPVQRQLLPQRQRGDHAHPLDLQRRPEGHLLPVHPRGAHLLQRVGIHQQERTVLPVRLQLHRP